MARAKKVPSDFSRIAVPESAVRTREQILAAAHVAHGMVWETCGNCGGSGLYPSGCIPAGMCRFYCWAVTTGKPDLSGNSLNGMEMVSRIGTKYADVFGKRSVAVDRYVKREQAADRRAYRVATWEEANRPAREAEAARLEGERQDRETERNYWEHAKAAAIAARTHLGAEGERITVDVRVEGIHSYESRFGSGRIVRMRDAESNQVVWFTSAGPGELRQAQEHGDLIRIAATVKKHDRYNGEAQTIVTRLAVAGYPTGAANV